MGKEHPMGKFGAWLAGLLAAIIAGYAVWFFTKPPATTTIEGMVYSGSSPVAKAMVVLTLTGDRASSDSVHNVTDDNGAYRFDFTGLPSGVGAILRVTAVGFRNSPAETLNSPLGLDTHMDIPLITVAAPPRELPDQAHPEVQLPKPRYIRKTADAATKIPPPLKP
jgi:hypothetical protein